jgi:hypothetical protein
MEQKLTRAEKLRLAGIKRFGSEAAWRKHLSESSNKADRTTPRGFAKIDPELHREISRKGGQSYKPSQKTES